MHGHLNVKLTTVPTASVDLIMTGRLYISHRQVSCGWTWLTVCPAHPPVQIVLVRDMGTLLATSTHSSTVYKRPSLHVLASQGGRDPCSTYDVQLEQIGWTQRVAVNRSVTQCEQFEFRDGAVTMVTEVSVKDLWHLDIQKSIAL